MSLMEKVKNSHIARSSSSFSCDANFVGVHPFGAVVANALCRVEDNIEGISQHVVNRALA